MITRLQASDLRLQNKSDTHGFRRASVDPLRHAVVPALICLLSAGLSLAFSSVLTTSVSKRELSVGDRIHLTVSIAAPKGATAVPPDPAAGFGSLTVKEWSNRKVTKGGTDSLVFDYELTTYKLDSCAIPKLPYIVASNGRSDTLTSDSIPLTVIHLCRSDSADIMGMKPQQVAGKRPLIWIWIALAGALLAAGGWLAGLFFRKRRSGPLAAPAKPPYEEALDAFAALDAKQYLLKGLVREYVFELSEILKRYSERRFGVNAAEFTTEEMLSWLQVSGLAKEQQYAMEWFYRSADPVKFAKFLPDQATIDRFGSEARAFVEATRPVPEPADAVTELKTGSEPAAAGPTPRGRAS